MAVSDRDGAAGCSAQQLRHTVSPLLTMPNRVAAVNPVAQAEAWERFLSAIDPGS
ncbi:hypothetical protein [Nocardia sp. NPDC046763]|uniref:hypothetical protein n=1 Tax=Nocardia sp. NPDC046763 TaxID=3155256 RepID=UPI0033E3A8AA